MEDDDEEGGDDEVVGADGPTAPEHDYPGHRSLSHPAESLHFPHCCCNKLERGGKKALRWMERVISEREGLHHKRLYNVTST